MVKCLGVWVTWVYHAINHIDLNNQNISRAVDSVDPPLKVA